MFGKRREPDPFHQGTDSEEDSLSFLPPTQARNTNRLSRANLLLWVLIATAFAQASVLGVQLWQWDRSAGTVLPTNSLLATCKYRTFHYQVYRLTLSQPARKR